MCRRYYREINYAPLSLSQQQTIILSSLFLPVLLQNYFLETVLSSILILSYEK